MFQSSESSAAPENPIDRVTLGEGQHIFNIWLARDSISHDCGRHVVFTHAED